LGVIFDANGRHGEDGAKALIDKTTAAMGGTPATGVNEIAWLNKFIAIRDVKLKSENLGDQDRQNGYKEDIAAGNYNLVTPYVIHTYGDPYTIDGILGVDLGGGAGLGTGGKSPVASFTSAAAGLSVTFTDKSSNTPTSWSWVFGDESTVIAENSKQNPSHTYTVGGTYQVKLTATNAGGSNSITIPVTVNVPVAKPVAFFSHSPTTVVHGNVVTFTDSSTNYPTRWKWTFSDTRTTVTTTIGKTTHTFRRAGTYTVSLVSSNSAGSSTSVSQSIKVS
jgi:PKD repeat protein